MYEKHGFGWLLDDPLELFMKKRTGTEIIHMLSLHVNKNKSKGIKR